MASEIMGVEEPLGCELSASVLDYVEVLYAVALKLTSETEDALELTLSTIWRVLKSPECFERAAHPKALLLKTLREGFVAKYRVKHPPQSLSICPPSGLGQHVSAGCKN